MARKVRYTYPTTDEDILRACIDAPMTRGEIAKSIERSLHAGLIARIERLADSNYLIHGTKTLINGVLANTYQTNPLWDDPALAGGEFEHGAQVEQ